MNFLRKCKIAEIERTFLSKTETLSPAWHKELLLERFEKIKSGKGKFLNLKQLKRRLKHRAG